MKIYMHSVSLSLVLCQLACLMCMSAAPARFTARALGDTRRAPSDELDNATTSLGILVQATVPADKRVFGDLLQVAFDKHPEIMTLERQAIDAVINEIEFSLFFEAGGLNRRIDASRLLDADVLVLVSPSSVRRDALNVVVVETRSGIRLLTHMVEADTDLVAAADALVDVTRPRLARVHAPTQNLIAVPSFVDTRLVRDGAPLGEQLAELVRGSLDRERGLQLIEVSDADSLSLELKLRGDDRLGGRGTPLYLLGEISGDPTRADVVELSLRIERSAEVLARRSGSKLNPTEATRYCLDALPGMLKEAASMEASHIQPHEESVRLLSRANTFLRAGDKRKAFELLQVAHLLDPDNTAVTNQSLIQIRALVWHALFDVASGVPFEERAQAAFDLYKTGLEQVKRELEASWFAPTSRRRAGVPMQQLMQYMIYADQKFVMRFNYSSAPSSEKGEKYLAEHIRPKVFEVRRELKNAMLKRLVDLAASGDVKGREKNVAWFFIDVGVYGETPEQEAAWRFEAFKALQDAPDLEVVARSLLQSNGLLIKLDHAPFITPRLSELSPRASKFLENYLHAQQQGSRVPIKRASKPRPEQNESNTKVDSYEAVTEKVELRVTQPQDGGARRVQPKGWFDCGEYGELLWHDTELFLVTSRDSIRSLYLLDADEHFWLDPTRESAICTPAYDGRYVWTALPIAEPQLIVIDPKDGTAHTFDKEAGLPPMDGGVSVAPLGPGRTLVTGSFGAWQNLRAWSAIVTYTPNGEIKVDVFREATSVDDVADAANGLKPYYTGESITLFDPNDPDNIVVLVDQPQGLDRMWHVSTRKLLVWPNQKKCRLWHFRDGISEGLALTTVLDGKLYYSGLPGRAAGAGAHILSFDMQACNMRSERPLREGEGFYSAAKYDGLYWVLGRSNRYDLTLFAGTDLLNATEYLGVLGNIGLYYEKLDKLYASKHLGLLYLSDISGGYNVARITIPQGLKEKITNNRRGQGR